MTTFIGLQGLLLVTLGVLAFCVELFALVDAATRPAPSFVAAGKQTKNRWLIILGIAVVLGLVSIDLRGTFRNVGILSIIAIIAAGIYLTDVRPAVRAMKGRGGRPGPYGSW